MSKYYYINETGKAFIVIGKEKKTYIDLNSDDTRFLLNNLIKSKVEHVRKNGETLNTTYKDGVVVVYSLTAFSNKYNIYSEYFTILRANINKYIEQVRLQKYKKTTGKRVKVNRTKSKSLGRLAVEATAVVATGVVAVNGLLALLFPDHSEEIENLDDTITLESIDDLNSIITQKQQAVYNDALNRALELAKSTQEIEPQTIEEEPVTIENNIVEEEVPVQDTIEDLYLTDSYTDQTPIESSYTFKVDFPDKTGNGKLEETKRLFGDAISTYAPRYGIPYNVACAFISQERPASNENPCQLIGLVGATFSADLYDANGPTGQKEVFDVTQEMVDDPTQNIKTGLAYLRYCIDINKSFITGLFGYNQGPFALEVACNYYGLNKNDYYGDEHAQEACELIINYYKDTKDGKHGDPNYLYNVFGYLDLEDRSEAVIDCYVKGVKTEVAISNTLYYNNGQSRG